jgi:hypothetical protein
MTDWKTQQMIDASGWPLEPAHLQPGADFNARLDGGLVPLHWACAMGKAGVLNHLLAHGARIQDTTADGQDMLTLAATSKDFQTVMRVVDALKAAGAPPPTNGLKDQLTHTFRASHTNARNRLQQTLKDWERLHKARPRQATPGPAAATAPTGAITPPPPAAAVAGGATANSRHPAKGG